MKFYTLGDAIRLELIVKDKTGAFVNRESRFRIQKLVARVRFELTTFGL